MSGRWTPIQAAIAELLSDGERHKREELRACINDEEASNENVQSHVSEMRKKLKARGQTIVCELYNGTLYYRHVALLASAGDGRT